MNLYPTRHLYRETGHLLWLYLETGRVFGTGHTVQTQVKQSKCQLEQPCLATLRENKQSFPNHDSHAATGGLHYLHGTHVMTEVEVNNVS